MVWIEDKAPVDAVGNKFKFSILIETEKLNRNFGRSHFSCGIFRI